MNTKEPTDETLLEAALSFPTPEERQTYLQGACSDPAQRVRVESLAKAHHAAGGFLREGPPSPQTTAPIQAGVDIGTDTMIGRYKLLQKIGEGGCGVVYMAEQQEPVRRRVALKVIKLGMDTRQVIARFEAERQALALMDHPNIAKVLDAGATNAGRPYFVMELVRGLKITDYCDQKALSTVERLRLFVQVCQAIQHAHQKGIIHRDIKPSNILVTVNDGLAVPKVIDFGIAKATVGQQLTDRTLFTAFEQFIGTPAYMSPEQVEMTSVDIDTRSDIYSLGVLLYELLTGKTPFDPQELMAIGIEEMRRTIREAEPMRPSTRLGKLSGEELSTAARLRNLEVPRLVSSLRGDLDWIVMKALEKDRARRYETANGLAMDVQRHLRNEPVMARPPSAAYRLQKLVRRHKLGFASASAVLTVLILGGVFSTWQAIRARQAERHAKGEARRALQAEATAKEQSAAAEQQRRRAEVGEAAARQRELEASRNLYASDMNLANDALETKNVGYALELLDRHRPRPGQPDLRGWEWRYLWKQTRSDALQALGSHSNTVNDAVFSPKGDLLATSSADRTVKLWDMVRRHEVATLPHEDSVRAAVFLAEGKSLATASADGLLRVWDLESFKEISRLRIGTINPPRERPSLAFSPRGELVAVADPDGTVNVWNVGTKAKTATLHGRPTTSWGPCVAFSWDAQVLAFGRPADALVELFDVARQERICSLTNAPEGVSTLAFSKDGRMLACTGKRGAGGGPILVWDLGTRQRIWTLSGHTSWVPKLTFSPDGKTLASAGSDHTAKLWNMDTGQSTTLHGHLNEVWAIAIAPDGQYLVTGTKGEGRVALWSALPKPAEKDAKVISSDVENVRRHPVLSPDGTALLKAYDDNVIGLWDTDTLSERTRFPLVVSNETCLAVSPGGKLVGRGDVDGSLKLLEGATGREAASLCQRGAGIERLEFSRDGSKLVTASADRKIRIWDVATHTVLHELEAHSGGVRGPVLGLGFSADGLTLGVGYSDSTAELFDLAGGKRLALLRGHKEAVCGAVLLPDGKTAVTASHDQAVKLWDVSTQRELESLHGEGGAVFSIALAPDGQRLAAGGRALRLWDPVTRQLVMILKGAPGDSFDNLAFSPEGNTLVAVTSTELRVWRAPSLAEIETAETGAGGRIR
jgi:WD40 repeat protein/serine/threonine protein kinase